MYLFLERFEEEVEGVKAAKKLAKSIMKESLYRNDVLLMDTYAQLERRGGKVEDSRRVCPLYS